MIRNYWSHWRLCSRLHWGSLVDSNACMLFWVSGMHTSFIVKVASRCHLGLLSVSALGSRPSRSGFTKRVDCSKTPLPFLLQFEEDIKPLP